MADDDLLKDAKEKFTQASDAESDNRTAYEDDIRFARHEEQWPEAVRKAREREGRPCLTISKLNAFSRQVVNDARQNKPSIKVHPADSGADPDTAEVINGLIRNIEYTSNADVAYDTAVDCAVNGGFGYIRVGLDYAYHDSFDMDLSIERVANPLSVYGDPNSTAADSSDWMDAFIVDRLSKDQFEAKYGKTKTIVDWDDSSWWEESWREGEDCLTAEWWNRVETQVKVAQFQSVQDNSILTYSADEIESTPEIQTAIEMGLLTFKRERMGKTFKTTQRIMTGAEILKTNDWKGCYIPIIPVYGDEYNIKGKRYFRSLIHSAKDAQQQFNVWRSISTEIALKTPRVPFVGEEGAFDIDPNWETANRIDHPYLEYKSGKQPPARQPMDIGPSAGILQEALNASDDMKAVIGLYDASLGARSNETSGKAIVARQREGDVSTFHFIDNMSRAIRHTGRILIDLIPHVYSGERIIRVMGEDGKPSNVPLGKQYPKVDPKTGQPMTQDGQPPAPDGSNVVMMLHDFSAGKYDLTVTTGPSFTTRREEAAYEMTEMMRAFPQSAPIIGPELAKNLDWPGADKIADKLDAMTSGQPSPEIQKLIETGKQQIQELTQKTQQLEAENAKLKGNQMASMAKVQQADQASQRDAMTSQQQMEIDGYDAETRRIAAIGNAIKAVTPPPITSADAPQ